MKSLSHGTTARPWSSCSLLLLTISGLTFGGPVAFAATSQPQVLEEIIVTGTKRDMSQQDTPIAISTLTAKDMERTFQNDIRAVSDLAPNVTLTNQTGFNALAGGIRGTGTISILTTQDPSVGLLLDEFSLNSVQSQLVELYDIQQVEVYRGPQGTLFGKNSDGGVIAITSKRPDLEQFGGEVKFNVGQYDANGDSDNHKLQAGIDIPIIEGQLGFRFAGSYTKEDGFYTNDKNTATFPNSPLFKALGIDPENHPGLLPATLLQSPTKGAGEQLGGREVLAAKSKILWQPNDRYEAYAIWEIVRDESDSPPGINETPAGEGFLLPLLGFPGIHEAGHNNPFSTGMTMQGNGINIRDGHRVDVDGYYLNQSLEFDKFTIKSITGYREQMETLPSTYTGEAFLSLFDATRNLEREQFQQELRLVSNLDGPINFVVGGIYLTDDLDFRSFATVGLQALFPTFVAGVPQFDLRNLTNDPGAGKVTQERESTAFFVDGTWDLNDRWSISAGTRWTNDEKDFHHPAGSGGPCNQYTEARDVRPVGTAITDPTCRDVRSTSVSRAGLTGAEISQRHAPLPDSAYAFVADDSDSWTETTWRLVADYALADDQKAYASVATGYISGGFSETCSQPITCEPYDPETNINYEVGYKADLFDKTLRLNVAVFYTEFEDLQRNQVFAFTDASGAPGQETVTLNAGKSTATGLELEATWLATDRLQIKGSIGLLNAEYDEFVYDLRPDDAIPPLDLSDLDVPFAPDSQAYIEASYDQPLSNGGNITYMASASYQDDAEMSPFDPNAAARGIARHPTYTQLQSRTLLNANVTFNSSDDRYYVTLYGLNLSDEEYRVSANSVGALWNFTMYGAPRQWGVEFGVNLE